jgi:hypothetical protein
MKWFCRAYSGNSVFPEPIRQRATAVFGFLSRHLIALAYPYLRVLYCAFIGHDINDAVEFATQLSSGFE